MIIKPRIRYQTYKVVVNLTRLNNLTTILLYVDVVQCNFDNGWCGFRNENGGDNFDWTLRSRSTPSLQTGPSSDISGKGRLLFT